MDLTNLEPRPMIFSRHDVVLSWAPKSACTHAIVWFFLKEGLLPASNYYNPWPHSFRNDVYYRTKTYLERATAVRASGGAGFTLVKVVRDPVKRMVASFRHACRFDFLRASVIATRGFDPQIEGLSLTDFYETIRERKLTVPSDIDFHVCGQVQPVWSAPFDRVITLNLDEVPLNESLNRIEAELNLGLTNFAGVPKFDALRRSHYTRDVPYDGPLPIEEVRFLPQATNPFPKHQLESSAVLRDMAHELYAADFPQVASGDTAGRLFGPAEPAVRSG